MKAFLGIHQDLLLSSRAHCRIPRYSHPMEQQVQVLNPQPECSLEAAATGITSGHLCLAIVSGASLGVGCACVCVRQAPTCTDGVAMTAPDLPFWVQVTVLWLACNLTWTGSWWASGLQQPMPCRSQSGTSSGELQSPDLQRNNHTY